VQPTFKIPVSVTDTSHTGLYIELGATGLSYVVMDHQKNITGTVQYSFSPELDQSTLFEAIKTVLNQ
jgi:predicted NBD/HSP70 family sugar kinase